MLTSLLSRPAEIIFASGANVGEVKDFPDLARGWGLTFDTVEAGGNGGFPPMEWVNFLMARLDNAIQYFLQRGISEWATTTLYAPGSLVSRGDLIFRALRSHAGIAPGTDPTAWSQLADASSATVLAPPGLVGLFPMPTAPSGWLKMNGASLSRTVYPALFGAIGTAFGAASSATFNLPDWRGEFVRIWDDGRGVDHGRGIGTWQGGDTLRHTHGGTALAVGDHYHAATAWTDVQGWHGHAVFDYGHAHGAYDVVTNQIGTDLHGGGKVNVDTRVGTTTSVSQAGITLAGDGAHAHNVGVSLGAGGAHWHAIVTDTQGGDETRPRNVAAMACIKY